jgi:SAM-dependent methyltransferase
MMTARAQPTAGREAQMVATAVEAWDERRMMPEGRADWLVPHPAMVPVLKARGAQHVLDLGCGVARHALLFADERFDYVLSWNVIFHGTMGDVGRRLTEIWRVLKPGGLYQGTMLSKRDEQFGRGRLVAPDTFIRGNDPKAHAHCYCDLVGLCCALRRLRASVADPGGATPSWLLALAHPRRTAVNGDGRTRAPPGRAGTTDHNSPEGRIVCPSRERLLSQH